jgi:hypothetical protein
MPQVQNVFAIVGYSIIDALNEPNSAFIVPTLKPFADRVGAMNSAQALIARVFGEGQQVRTATVHPFNLPPIIELSTTGGFEYELEAPEGQEPAEMNSVMQGLIASANRDPRLNRIFSTYTASNPSIYLDIDREKAQALGLGMNDVFGALQATRWAESTSTTSICSAGSGRSTSRVTRPTAPMSPRCGRSTFAINTALTFPCARLPKPMSWSDRKSSPATTIIAPSRGGHPYRAGARKRQAVSIGRTLKRLQLDDCRRGMAGFAPNRKKFVHGLVLARQRQPGFRDGECQTTIRRFAPLGCR